MKPRRPDNWKLMQPAVAGYYDCLTRMKTNIIGYWTGNAWKECEPFQGRIPPRSEVIKWQEIKYAKNQDTVG